MRVSEATVVKVPTVPSPSSQAMHCLLEPGTARLAGAHKPLTGCSQYFSSCVWGDMVCVCGGEVLDLADYWGRLCVPRYAMLELGFFFFFKSM